MHAEELAKTIDHTLLRADTTRATSSACAARRRSTTSRRSACSRTSCRSPHDLLRGADVKVCAVISFPFGADALRAKVAGRRRGRGRGADEVDVVINLPAFLSGEFGHVRDELASVVRAVRMKASTPGAGR